MIKPFCCAREIHVLFFFCSQDNDPDPFFAAPLPVEIAAAAAPAAKRAKTGRKDKAVEKSALPPPPPPPIMSISTKARDYVLELVEAVQDAGMDAESWRELSETEQRHAVSEAAKRAHSLRKQHRAMKEQIQRVVEILDDESRHSEFFHEMVSLSELADESL